MIDRVLLLLLMVFCMVQFSMNIYQSVEVDRLKKQVEYCRAYEYSLSNDMKRTERMIDQTLTLIAEGGWE